ncbi:MAG: dethiobiotin synthase [Epsilonproteobacteria bacterium]|nr:dethiobiotin synthase [Campylobacterota bacterium]
MKVKTIFITATNTDVGKTYATIKIINELQKKGLKVGIFKPFETGVQGFPLDGKLLLEAAQKTNLNFHSFKLCDVVPFQYSLPAAPYVAKYGAKIDMKILKNSYKKIALASDIVLIEGAGGLMVPIEKEFYMYDLAKFFDAKILLVTHSNLGCINDTLLNLYFLKSQNIEFEWCVNIKNNEDDFKKTTLPFYKDKFGKVLTLQDNLEEIVEKLST